MSDRRTKGEAGRVAQVQGDRAKRNIFDVMRSSTGRMISDRGVRAAAMKSGTHRGRVSVTGDDGAGGGGGFAARWESPELRASDSDALPRPVPRRARAGLAGAQAAPGPAGRERRDAAPNRRISGEHFGLPKAEGRAPRCGTHHRLTGFPS